MLLKNKPRWAIAERDATPEHVFWNRRRFLGAAAGASVAGGAYWFLQGGGEAMAQAEPEAPIAPELYPADANPSYVVDRPLTKKEDAFSFNNFYEFGSHKYIQERAQALRIRPWEVVIDGMVGKEVRADAEELIRKIGVEERVYRFRCVEAWAMTVPWSGFPLKKLLALAEPQAGAKFVRMETFYDPEVAIGQRQRWSPWPYIEGLTVEEADHDLAFIATGAYGQPIPKQMGAPLRLAAPWKYGFKSTKSIVRFTLTDERPISFWEDANANEYGFWANVNPEVPHPRWSQAQERILGRANERRPTVIFNGYAEEVAGLYPADAGRPYFM